MRSPFRHEDREGLQMVAVAISIVVVATLFGLIHAQNGRSLFRWSEEIHVELRARDVLESALAEATLEAMRAVNDPGSPAFEIVRTAPLEAAIRFEPELARTRELFGRIPGIESLRSEVRLQDRRALGPGPDPGPDRLLEWSGHLFIEVRLVADGRRDKEMLLREVREVKATSVLPPAPFDRLAWFEWNDPPPGFQARPLPVQPEYWRDVGSTLRIETGAGRPGVHQAIDALIGRLDGVLNGVVFVDNPDQPLVLDNVVHRGRAVLVVRGPLRISDLELEDPELDSLVVIALDRVILEGDIEAAVMLASPPGETPPERVFRSVNMLRPLHVLTGTYTIESDARRPPDLAPMNPDPEPWPGHVYVSISPWIVARHGGPA